MPRPRGIRVRLRETLYISEAFVTSVSGKLWDGPLHSLLAWHALVGTFSVLNISMDKARGPDILREFATYKIGISFLVTEKTGCRRTINGAA